MTALWLALAMMAGGVVVAVAPAGAQLRGTDSGSLRDLPTDTDVTDLDAEEGMRPSMRARLGAEGLPRPVVQEGPVDAERYLLGPGDLLQVDLWGRLVRTVPLEVSPEGKIFLPGTGPLDVNGRTLAWARREVLRQIAETFRGVRADVRLIRLRTFKVFITGFATPTGPVEVNSAMRASEAVRMVKIPEEASMRNIEVRRRDGSVQRVDIVLATRLGRLEYDPMLVDGDVIHVPASSKFVEVLGAVHGPAPFELGPTDSLSTLLALGGGPKTSAVTDSALLVRFTDATERESLWVDLDALVAGRGDLPLRDGDRLFVQSQAQYHVLPDVEVIGEVNQPGTYPIVPGQTRFSDAIRWSGGFRPLANQSAILLLRSPAEENERDPEFDRLVRLARSEMTESEYAKFQTKLAQRKNSFRVDWLRVRLGRDDVDPLLQPGDLVRVDLLVPSVRVEGEVRRPGFVDYEQGRSLGEYVNLAGGYTDRASRRGVRISRAVTGQVIPARSLRTIQPGDFIWVPERRDVDAWAVFRDVVTVAGQVAVVIFTLSR